MEGLGSSMDDQGWCEVRKKHKGGSKHAVQCLGGARNLSTKRAPCAQENFSRKNYGLFEDDEKFGTSVREFKGSRIKCGAVTDSNTNSFKIESIEYGSKNLHCADGRGKINFGRSSCRLKDKSCNSEYSGSQGSSKFGVESIIVKDSRNVCDESTARISSSLKTETVSHTLGSSVKDFKESRSEFYNSPTYSTSKSLSGETTEGCQESVIGFIDSKEPGHAEEGENVPSDRCSLLKCTVSGFKDSRNQMKNDTLVPKIKWGVLDDDDLVQHSANNLDCNCRINEYPREAGHEKSTGGHEKSSIQDVTKIVVLCSDLKVMPDSKTLDVKISNWNEPSVGSVVTLAPQDHSTSTSDYNNRQLIGSSDKDHGQSLLASRDSVSGSEGSHIIGTSDSIFFGHEENSSVHADTCKPDIYQEFRMTSDIQSIDALVEDNSSVIKQPNRLENGGDVIITTNEHSSAVKSVETRIDVKLSSMDRDKEEASEVVYDCYVGNEISPLQEMNENHMRVRSINEAGEGAQDESKERFRDRLWCLLFENLNRAMDELYLLCELECDAEQTEEAIVVLEEAISDFQDLSKRVHDFEHVKKLILKPVFGSPGALKSDHRRPHALSWEVRRMTTSSQKAELLSSSLEAFKKIQQERATKADASSVEIEGRKSNDPLEIAEIDAMKDCNADKNSELKRKEVLKVHDCDGIHHQSSLKLNDSKLPSGDCAAKSFISSKKRESEDKLVDGRKKLSFDGVEDCNHNRVDQMKKNVPFVETNKDKKASMLGKPTNAWKEERNWERVLSSPFPVPSRASFSPSVKRRSADRARNLHDKLMSPEKKKKNATDLKREAEEKHARALRIRTELEMERAQKLQRTSEKLNRVTEWQAIRKIKMVEELHARHQRSESRHEAFIAKVVKRAGNESSKVSEVRFITSLIEENKRLILRQKLQDSEFRRAEKLQIMKSKQKEDVAREEAAIERRKLIEAGKLRRLAETQRKKEEAQMRREEERKASSAAREARALEQLRRREERAKALQEEAELMAQKLAERLNESEQRRKFYLEQIREKASMDFRDQSSPLLRRAANRETQARSTPPKGVGGCNESGFAASPPNENISLQHSAKRKIKKIRQKLTSLKYEFTEPPVGAEAAGIGYRTAVGTARVKIGKWLQELQRLRQARKEGAASIGLITADIIKFLDGKDAELQAARQSGLLDFIASALPASHTSKPQDCIVTVHFLRLLRVALSCPSNVSYILAQNLLPPIVPLLASALENFVKVAASAPARSPDNLDTVAEVFEGFLVVVDAVMGHSSADERELRMQDGLLELIVAYQVIHRLRDHFALHDRPQAEGSPFPSSILLSIHLLSVLTCRPAANSEGEWEVFLSECMRKWDAREGELAEHLESLPSKDDEIAAENDEKISDNMRDQSVSTLLSAVSETGLVCLPSLLTAVLLQANNRMSSELGTYTLPSNFEEVATAVLKVLNNVANMDVAFMQRMLARPDLKTEFFHLMSFLLSHCTTKWKAAGDQVGLLLLESLALIAHFSLFHADNQAVLRWGKTPTILHKVCDLPFVFFSDATLMPALGATLIAACYGSKLNKSLVLQELSMDMLLSLVNSCKAQAHFSAAASETSLLDEPPECSSYDPKRLPARKSQRVLSARGHVRRGKSALYRDSKRDEVDGRGKGKEALHKRLPGKFFERVELFLLEDDATCD